MSIPKTASIIIIGGGVMGASTAYHLASKGVKDIVLLEKEEFFGQGATGRCAGGVRYQFSTEINIELSKLSLPMLERFKIELDQDIDYRKCGYLFILCHPKDIDSFKHNVGLQKQLGVETKWLSGDDVRKMVPL
ncbi:NAD(P)/FAD-dependent oxidoreductase, partial [Chloroflexota bacterium]